MRLPNAYGPAWVDAFLRTRDPAQTVAEVAFIVRRCPQLEFRRVLDVACGLGRHARALALQGYRVVGVERDVDLVREASRDAPASARFVAHDMEALGDIPGEFDAVLSLWHSFGYLDDLGNAGVLASFAAKLRVGGRLVLDVNHRGYFERKKGRRAFLVGGRTVTEERHLVGNRETVHIDYGAGEERDVFEWRLYTPEELIAVGAGAGLACVLACSRFDETVPATSAEPRMQLVFEKRGNPPA